MTHGHYFDAAPAVGSRQGSFVTVAAGGRVVRLATDRGVFGGGLSDLDRGTAALLKVAPPPPEGARVLDVGCGYGPIALWAAVSSPTASVWAIDVNERAVALCASNAVAAGVGERVVACAPDDVPAHVEFDVLYSNPPIRVGKAALHDLLLRWLARMSGGGVAWLVVQRHLGSDSLAAWMEGEGFVVERAASKSGYRVLRVSHH